MNYKAFSLIYIKSSIGLTCKTMFGDHDNSYHLFQHCLVGQIVYNKIPFILFNKCYYTIQKICP